MVGLSAGWVDGVNHLCLFFLVEIVRLDCLFILFDCLIVCPNHCVRPFVVWFDGLYLFCSVWIVVGCLGVVWFGLGLRCWVLFGLY